MGIPRAIIHAAGAQCGLVDHDNAGGNYYGQR